MKCVGKLENINRDMQGNYLVTFKTNSSRAIEQLSDISTNDYLDIEVDEVKTTRTMQQNKYMWALIHEIDKAINGYRANNPMQIYIQALIETGAKYEYIVCQDKAKVGLLREFRAVELIKPYDKSKGTNVYRVFYGSSTFDTKEMGDLIDYLIDKAISLGLDGQYWKGIFEEVV